MKSHVKLLVSVTAFTLFFGCAAQMQQKPQACGPPAGMENLVRKADNFLVILDTSETMGGMYKGAGSLQTAKCLVARMNQCIPADLKLNGGLRVFGRGYRLFSIGQTDLLYGMASYCKTGLSEALDEVTFPCGDSPLAKALVEASCDLKGLPGKSAVIVVSDGKPTDQGVLEAAEAMKKAYGERVCIYTVQIGDNYDAELLMKRLAAIGGCGFSINADQLGTCEEMACFVKKVFFETGCPDSDGDGVCDDADACPGTPVGAKVDARGCWVIGDVVFDFDKAVLRPDAVSVLDECVAVLKKCPGAKISIEGHTDNRGPAAYNVQLSRRRAEAVKAYFVEQGIDAANLSTQGYGLSKPVASNETSQGRARNRRVELHVK